VETIWGSTRIRDRLGRFDHVFNPGSSSCVGIATPGRDAVYRVPLAAGQVLRASAQAENTLSDLVVYIVSDCENPQTSCLDAARFRNGQTMAGYHARVARDVYVVVDTEFAGSTGMFTLDIDIDVPECEPEVSSYCQGDTYMACDRLGRYQPVQCVFGCGFEGCLAPSNDGCDEALDATRGLGFTGEIGAYTANYPAPSGCGAGTGAGPEAVFYVDVEAFDMINVIYQANDYNTAVWITRDCSGGAETCVAGTSAGGFGQPETLQYVAEQAGRYYIVADSSSTVARGGFEIDIWVEPPLCSSGQVVCVNATTLGVCGPRRDEYLPYTCQGGCSHARCGVPRGDICEDVIDGTGGGTFVGDFSTLMPRLSPPFGGCTGFDAPGPEAIYAVPLVQGQTLTARLFNLSGDTDLSLYVVTDCHGAANTCVAGSDAYGSVDENVVYTAPVTGTVYVVADSYTANATGRFELNIDIQ
jgi:hypothetical protein